MRASRDARSFAEGYYAAVQNNMEVPGNYKILPFCLPPAKKIYQGGVDMIQYLDGVKKELNKKCDSVKYAEWPEPGNNFIKSGNAAELFKKLVIYKTELSDLLGPEAFAKFLSRSNEYRIGMAAIKQRSPVLTDYINSDKYLVTWMNGNFSNASFYLCRAILTKIEYDINSSSAELLGFLANNTRVYFCRPFNRWSMITGITSSYVKASEQMEVIAGMGEFGYPDSLQIRVNGVKMPLNSEGVITYQFKATIRPGSIMCRFR